MKFLARSIFVLIVLAPAARAQDIDVVLIGGGIMSATLGTLLHELDPNLKIQLFERLDELACESSGTLNNAGSGHAALCELNYTPQGQDGEVDVGKAVRINEDFELSKEFWAFLSERRGLGDPAAFIRLVPHLSWVRGEANVEFLRRRFAALQKYPHFGEMKFSHDPEVLKRWIPLVMNGRSSSEAVAATRSDLGTDVDFGNLTRRLVHNLEATSSITTFVRHEVREIHRGGDGRWNLLVNSLETGVYKGIRAKFVFIGAGGGSLHLLQKSRIPEASGYGGFPVGGEFLMYKGGDLERDNFAKIYGQAAVGAPPMSVPHLDTRIVEGKKRLLFGPFASATTRFLKKGSIWDLMHTLRFDNTRVMLQAGAQNVSLVSYLLGQEMQSHEDRMNALREFIPNARSEDWELIEAGLRVQIIHEDQGGAGGNVLRFGTEVVSSADGSLAALLGASPGASTSVAAMLEVLQRSFPERMASPEWRAKLAAIVPSYGLPEGAAANGMRARRERTARILKLLPGDCAYELTAIPTK